MQKEIENILLKNFLDGKLFKVYIGDQNTGRFKEDDYIDTVVLNIDNSKVKIQSVYYGNFVDMNKILRIVDRDTFEDVYTHENYSHPVLKIWYDHDDEKYPWRVFDCSKINDPYRDSVEPMVVGSANMVLYHIHQLRCENIDYADIQNYLDSLIQKGEIFCDEEDCNMVINSLNESVGLGM